MAEFREKDRSKFIGFDRRDFVKCTSFDVVPGPPGFEEHHNLFSFPNSASLYREDGSVLESSRFWYIENYMLLEKEFIAAKIKFERYLPSSMPIPKDYDIEERPVVFMGSTVAHYGHFIYDGLARMWPLISGDVDPHKDHLIMAQKGPLPIFAEQMLSTIDASKITLTSPWKPTLYRNVRIVLPSVNYISRIFQDYAAVHTKIAERLRSKKIFDRPVFLSRSGLNNNITSIKNEDKIEDIFAEKGFHIVRPERLTISDQIALFSTCPLIVGSIGSAFHNILFEPPEGDRIRVVLANSNPGKRFAAVDSIKLGHKAWYLNVMPKRSHTTRDESLSIDVEQTKAYFKELPFTF